MMKCPVFKECGGCTYAHDNVERQNELKQNRLRKGFSRLDDFLFMENPFFYRHKVIATFEARGNKVISGMYQPKSHKVVSTKDCLIENELARKIINTSTKLIEQFKYPIYDQFKFRGLFRHILVRVGYNTNEVMVVFVVTDTQFKGKRQFINKLLSLHPEITTIVFNINTRKTSIVLGEKNEVSFGPGFILDKIHDKTFKLSPNSFYQVNPKMTQRLYDKAIQLANLNMNDVVLDTYCGIGTITLLVADKVKEVVGVELNKSAIKDAILNKKMNKSPNVSFFEADSTQYLTQLKDNPFNVLIMDPPRTGSTPQFLNKVNDLNFEKVIYISCNPETLKRDLRILEKRYDLVQLVGVDQFPFTDHIEVISILKRKNL